MAAVPREDFAPAEFRDEGLTRTKRIPASTRADDLASPTRWRLTCEALGPSGGERVLGRGDGLRLRGGRSARRAGGRGVLRRTDPRARGLCPRASHSPPPATSASSVFCRPTGCSGAAGARPTTRWRSLQRRGISSCPRSGGQLREGRQARAAALARARGGRQSLCVFQRTPDGARLCGFGPSTLRPVDSRNSVTKARKCPCLASNEWSAVARKTARCRHSRKPANWIQLGKFACVGASGYVVNLAVYTLLLKKADIHYLSRGWRTARLFLVAASWNLLVEPPLDVPEQRGSFALPRARGLSLAVSGARLSSPASGWHQPARSRWGSERSSPRPSRSSSPLR